MFKFNDGCIAKAKECYEYFNEPLLFWNTKKLFENLSTLKRLVESDSNLKYLNDYNQTSPKFLQGYVIE